MRRHKPRHERWEARVWRRRSAERRRIFGRAIRWAHKLGHRRNPRADLTVCVTPHSLVGDAWLVTGECMLFRTKHVGAQS